MQLSNLESRWNELFLNFQVEPTLSKKTFFDVVGKYSGYDRYYHNLVHIEHVLNIASILEPLAQNFPAIQITAWFHDVIYDPQANDNEEKSAKFASASLKSLNVPQTIINHVTNMILQTKTHHPPLEDIDSQILLDADLSILGAENSEYMEYAQAIRQEYFWLSDAEYRVGRKRVLENFLQRNRIYFTDNAFQMLELKARENMTAEIS